MSFGFEPGQPPSMYGHAELVEHPGDPQLVGEREGDVLALGAVAQGRVVEDDRRRRRTRVTAARRSRGRRPTRPSAVDRPVAIAWVSPSCRRVGSSLGAGRPRSAVRNPSSSAALTAASIASAASARPSDQRRSIAADRIVPIGFALSWPAMSGAEPWIGSYSPNVPWAVRRSPSDADGSIPSEPASTPPRRTGCRRTGSRSRARRSAAGCRTSSIAHESTS